MTIFRWRYRIKDKSLPKNEPYAFQNYGRLRYAKKRREEGMTYKAIGALLGVTTERVRQMVTKHDEKKIESIYPAPYDVFKAFKQHYDEVIDQ